MEDLKYLNKIFKIFINASQLETFSIKANDLLVSENVLANWRDNFWPIKCYYYSQGPPLSILLFGLQKMPRKKTKVTAPAIKRTQEGTAAPTKRARRVASSATSASPQSQVGSAAVTLPPALLEELVLKVSDEVASRLSPQSPATPPSDATSQSTGVILPASSGDNDVTVIGNAAQGAVQPVVQGAVRQLQDKL